MRTRWRDIFNIPNLLGYLRLLLLPVICWQYLQGSHWVAMGLIALSGITDFLDGYIARRFQMVTQWGKALDPIADKVTQVVLALMLMMRVAPARALFAILLIKESAMGVANLLLMPSGNRLDGAMWFGKVSTAALYVGLVALIALPQMPPWMQTLLVAVCSALLLLSAALYVPVFAHKFKQAREQSAARRGACHDTKQT
ncbi:MAG: CDP-alcohol phosphatidyltransferase family protein [Christensenellales bacterium]|jgi:cardiolipin synthase